MKKSWYVRSVVGATAGILMTAATPGSTLSGEPANATAGDAEAGAELYSAQCRGCHTVSIAPTLRGVVGRPIASVADFGGYSDGLKSKAPATWTEATLDKFLAAPQSFAPGTRMVVAVADAQARADIIAYLETLPRRATPADQMERWRRSFRPRLSG